MTDAQRIGRLKADLAATRAAVAKLEAENKVLRDAWETGKRQIDALMKTMCDLYHYEWRKLALALSDRVAALSRKAEAKPPGSTPPADEVTNAM